MLGQGDYLLLYLPLFDPRRIIEVQIIDGALLHEPAYHKAYDIDRNKIAMKAMVSQKSTLLSQFNFFIQKNSTLHPWLSHYCLMEQIYYDWLFLYMKLMLELSPTPNLYSFRSVRLQTNPSMKMVLLKQETCLSCPNSVPSSYSLFTMQLFLLISKSTRNILSLVRTYTASPQQFSERMYRMSAK